MTGAPLTFDRATGRLDGASALERWAVAALRAGTKASELFHYRGYSIGARMVSAFLDQRDIKVQLEKDALFAFPLGDGYWSKLLDRSFIYEQDLDVFLRHIAAVDYTFVDCGANFGLWSVLVSSGTFGSHPVIAIEASGGNLAWLEKNRALNDGRFTVLHRAVSERTGEKVHITGAKHEQLSILPTQAAGGEEVETLALDALLDQGLLKPEQRAVIKLDVEGVEVEAVRGASRLLAGDVVLICEDHGSDRQHTVTRHLMDAASCRVFMFDPAIGRFERVTDLSTLDRLKPTTFTGYDVFATRSGFWEEHILSARARVQH